MIKQFETVKSILPDWIQDENPQFLAFLEDYYKWMSESNIDQGYLYNHMDFLFLKKNVDSYVEMFMESRYPDIPAALIKDKTFMVRWSSKLNAMRGTPDIYHLLFFLLFDEEVEITYPRDNVLKLSNAKWIKPKNVIYVSCHEQNFTTSEIIQDIKIIDGQVLQFGHYTCLMLELDKSYNHNIDTSKPIVSINGRDEYLIPTSNKVKVVNGGKLHYVNEIIYPKTTPEYTFNIVATVSGSVDFGVSASSYSEVTVKVNNSPLYIYEINNSVLYSSFINSGDVVVITIKGYTGELQVKSINSNGSVTEIIPVKPFIGRYKAQVKVDDLVLEFSDSTIVELSGYYKTGSSVLDVSDKIQDSDYYQDYSYDISSNVIPETYREMVKDYVHPAGYKLFTTALSDTSVTNKSLKTVEDVVDVADVEFNHTAIRAVGNNYKMVALSYKANSFSVPELTPSQLLYMNGERGYLGYDYDMVCKQLIEEAYYIIYADDGANNGGYDENAISDITNYIRKNYIDPKYFNDVSSLYYATVGTQASTSSLYIPYSYITEGYFALDMSHITEVPKGWMNRSNIAFVDFYYAQQYTEEKDTGDTYFESGYIQ